MENNLQESIIRTITYFDIFDYPITLIELKKYLDEKISVTDEELLDAIDSIYIIRESQGYYYMLGREEIVGKRQVRSELSISKMIKAKIVAKVLSRIPFVKLIGVSGSLSMNNSLGEDDIDLFFITQKKALWITRFLVSIILLIAGQKRMRKSKMGKDKICPNMYLSEDSLAFPKASQNLYTAHELLQLKVLYEKDGFYAKLLSNNKWVNKLLPNGRKKIEKSYARKSKYNYLAWVLSIINTMFFVIQNLYMSKVRTVEKVTKNSALFHPIDKGLFIMQLFELKSKTNIQRFESNQWIESEEARYYFDEKKIRILN